MKALSLLQPWASLVVIGAKRIETRSWSTNHRGPLIIHASARFPRECRDRCTSETFRGALATAGYLDWTDLPTAALLGTVELVDCLSTSVDYGDDNWIEDVSDDEWEFGDYTPGRFGWKLRDPVRFELPRPAKGHLGLWECDLDHPELPAPPKPKRVPAPGPQGVMTLRW